MFMSFSPYPIDKDNELYQQNSRALYEFVKRETDAGRPCVLWGTYVPEFAVAIGCHDDHYHVSSFRPMIGQKDEPIHLADLDLVAIHYALAFPARSNVSRQHADRGALTHAARLLTQRGEEPDYGWSQEGYQRWIAALENNEAHAFGNAYNAQCWQEMRHHAGEFLKRIGDRHDHVAAPLAAAAGHFADTAGHLKQVAELYSFPPKEETIPEADRTAGVGHLKDAAACEGKAIDSVLAACNVPWEIKHN